MINGIKKRFWAGVAYFRTGHGLYTSFVVNIFNFIILAYNFIILKYTEIFPYTNFIWFSLIAVTGLIVLNIIIGRFHFKSEAFKREQIIHWDNNPRTEEITRLLKEINGKLK
jgi:hypothetical protein